VAYQQLLADSNAVYIVSVALLGVEVCLNGDQQICSTKPKKKTKLLRLRFELQTFGYS